MARGRPKKQPSIAELQQALAQRRSQRGKLMTERKKLQGRLEQLDREIAALDGKNGSSSSGGSGGSGGRKRNERPLPDVIESVLKKGGKAMRVGDILTAVEQSGYQSNSTNFRGIINQALIKDKRFTSASRGMYQLA